MATLRLRFARTGFSRALGASFDPRGGRQPAMCSRWGKDGADANFGQDLIFLLMHRGKPTWGFVVIPAQVKHAV